MGIGALTWIGLSILWSYAPVRGLEYAAHMAGVGAIATIGVSLAKVSRLRPFGMVFLLCLAVAALWLAANGLMNHWPSHALGISHSITYLNRSAIALALWLPLSIAILGKHKKDKLLFSAIIILIILSILLSDSLSAKIAMVVAFFAYALLRIFPVLFPQLCMYSAPLIILLVPFYIAPLMRLLPQSFHDAGGYNTVTVRAEMWSAFSAMVYEKPWLGYGMESSNVVATTPLVIGLPETVRAVIGYGHVHNAPLQLWFELGFPGAAFAAVLTFLYFRKAAGLCREHRVLAITGGLQALIIAFVSHGAWQAWWYALLALVAISITLWRNSERGAQERARAS